ncbi:MAG: tetraacyldisaccharide 4'-kinase [Saprospiraceae bacterium]
MNFQEILAKILLFPLSLLYGLGVNMRNFFYKTKMLRSVEFDIPVISVGNLSVGGAGKTPHIEYLIELLRPYLFVATLSRGYKRKTEGFIAVLPEHTALQVGDEPLQYKRKYPDVFVTVSENRAFGIPKLMMQKPDTQVILLDDAFQHRAVTPGLNILLTEYSRLYTDDFLLPMGRLREWSGAAKRADIIIVTKCPLDITTTEKEKIRLKLAPEKGQQMYFTYYDYPRDPYYILNGQQSVQLTSTLDILMVSGIARADYLADWLNTKVNSVRLLEFADHHFFTASDIGHIQKVFESINSGNKVIITTEKDAVRFQMHYDYIVKEKLPVFALPTKVAFHFNEAKDFDSGIKKFLLDFRA